MQAQQPPFDKLIKTLDGVIAEVSAAKFPETAMLLNIARIDLIARATGISEQEFEAFLSALENKRNASDFIVPSQPKKRQRKVANI
jgi:hypothetical protein